MRCENCSGRTAARADSLFLLFDLFSFLCFLSHNALFVCGGGRLGGSTVPQTTLKSPDSAWFVSKQVEDSCWPRLERPSDRLRPIRLYCRQQPQKPTGFSLWQRTDHELLRSSKTTRSGHRNDEPTFVMARLDPAVPIMKPVARMEQSEIRDLHRRRIPHSALLHAGYAYLIWPNSDIARSNLSLKSHIASRIWRIVADVFALSALPKAKMLLLRRYPMIRGSEIS